jgi:hypothetical protein
MGGHVLRACLGGDGPAGTISQDGLIAVRVYAPARPNRIVESLLGAWDNEEIRPDKYHYRLFPTMSSSEV